jgi:hypothetical protein
MSTNEVFVTAMYMYIKVFLILGRLIYRKSLNLLQIILHEAEILNLINYFIKGEKHCRSRNI